MRKASKRRPPTKRRRSPLAPVLSGTVESVVTFPLETETVRYKPVPRFAFDLDGTLCTETNGRYGAARPKIHRIQRVRELHAAGAHITIDSARGSLTGDDWTELTKQQLASWNVPYHELRVGEKPFAHLTVCDRSVSDAEFFGDAIVERWPDTYFDQRHGNDPRRQQAFQSENRFLRAHDLYEARAVCDVGCSTGEFLQASLFCAHFYGMEVNAAARAEAMKRGIRFDRNILTERAFFDVVVFRGTIQHLPNPFSAMHYAYRALKPGGHIAFLATPNTGSVVYRLFQRLPVSDDARNYWMPSAATLANALRNIGFEVVATEYPYLDGGYARPLHDALAFAKALCGGPVKFPWPGNMMNLIARRP